MIAGLVARLESSRAILRDGLMVATIPSAPAFGPSLR